MWDEKSLDAAIDEAARQLTASEPGGDFRARVMARIESAPRFWASWQPLAAGLAAAAGIGLAVIVWRHPTQTAAPAREARVISSSVAAAPAVSLETIPLRNDTPVGSRTVRPKAGAKHENELDRSDRLSVDSLTTPPLYLESIAVDALTAGEPIHIEPLPTAAPIAVAPLSAENEGDPR